MTKTYSSLAEIRADLADLRQPDAGAIQAATDRNGVLTKPPGALGRLEEIAIWYAGWRGEAAPQVTSPQIAIFAGNHGIAAKGVSAFPSDVTAQMVLNFKAGGAAINQLAKLAGASFSVHPIALDTPTANFTEGTAMSEEEFLIAFNLGASSVVDDSDLLVVGEMGIGNTTAAAALLARAFGGDAADWVGRGTGLTDDGMALKAKVVADGLSLHSDAKGLDALMAFGGREIAAMAGAILAARSKSVPVIVDGFICTSAVAALWSENPSVLDHCIAGHKSDEQAHAQALAKMKLDPLLDLGLRLGEGSGAALAIQIVKGALACHSGMATFAEAGVSGAD